MQYPLYYFYRKNESDKGFVLARMSVIPGKYKQRVCDRYDALFRGESSRKKANTYLHRVARWFRGRNGK